MIKENYKKMKVYMPVLEWGSNFNLKNFMKNAPKEWFNNIPGGKANGKAPNEFDIDEIVKGATTQMEHTDNPLIATEIAMDHEEQHEGYYNDDTGLPAMEAELDANEDTIQHQFEYMKNIDGKRAIDIIEFAIEEYGPDVINDTKLINLLEHFAQDLGHVVEGELAYMNTDIGPVHEKNEKI